VLTGMQKHRQQNTAGRAQRLTRGVLLRGAGIPANLLLVAAVEVPHSHSSPAELSQGRKVTVRAGGTVPLRNTEDIHQRLAVDPL
jgi:hypothetical protein